MFSGAVAGLIIMLVVVLLRRPEVLVLAVPLLGYLLHGLATRPVRAPTMTADVGVQTLYEGDATETLIEVDAPGAAVAAVWQPSGPGAPLVRCRRGLADRCGRAAHRGPVGAAAAGVPGLLGLMIAGLVAVTAMAVVVMRSTRPAARVHR